MMNILHFGCNYLPNGGGNVERMRNMLENTEAYTNDSIYVLTTAKPQLHFDDELYYNKTGIRIIRITSLKKAIFSLNKLLNELKIDIIVTHIIPANIIACLCAPKKIKIVTEVHSLIQSDRLKMIGKDLAHRFFLNRRTERYFVLSEGAKKYIINHYGVQDENIVFLPNGYERVANDMRSGNPNYFTFGYVGTFHSWQGIDVIYNNIDEILAIDSTVRILLVGSGTRYSELKALSLEEKYKGRLIVPGLIPREKIADYVSEIDVLMIPRPSTLETETAIPLKIFEAISYGKPVIISKVFGLTEVLNENEAFVFDPQEKKGLLKMCKLTYKQKELCNQKYINASEKLESWPSWRSIHNKQRDVLEVLIREGR